MGGVVSVGTDDGVSDSIPESPVVGLFVGTPVPTDCILVGENVGAIVGTNVGESVGATVDSGTDVGAISSVGFSVGDFVGLLTGDLLGKSVDIPGVSRGVAAIVGNCDGSWL